MPPAADSPAPAEAARVRFAADLDRLWPEGRRDGARLGLAVSGGPDSTAMLLLAASHGAAIEAITVDHGLRPESAAEAAAVAAMCADLGVAHRIAAVRLDPGNLQAEARRARYAAMRGWLDERGLGALATAHHADDQVETLVMRLNRGSGLAGLAGVRARGAVPGSRVPMLRPLLGWRRAELHAVVASTGIVAADDPSNAADRFDRVRVRKALASVDWLDVPAAARSAINLADADEALEWTAMREWRESVRQEALGWRYRPSAPRAIVLRVVARIVAAMDESEPRGSAVARLVDDLEQGKPAMIGDLVVRPDVGGWSFARAPKRRTR